MQYFTLCPTNSSRPFLGKNAEAEWRVGSPFDCKKRSVDLSRALNILLYSYRNACHRSVDLVLAFAFDPLARVCRTYFPYLILIHKSAKRNWIFRHVLSTVQVFPTFLIRIVSTLELIRCSVFIFLSIRNSGFPFDLYFLFIDRSLCGIQR